MIPVRRLLSIAALALCAAPASAAGPAFDGTPSGVFRSAAYDRGEWIYTNGIHQANGANTDGLHRTDYFKAISVPGDPTGDTRDISLVLTYNFFGVGRAARNGDFRLPADDERWPDGTADLAELRLALDGGDLVARFVWNAMPRPDAQIATLTFAEKGAGGDARAWPRGAGVSSPWQAAVTNWGTGAALTGADGKERALPARAGDHFTEVRIPLSALPDGPWTLTGGAGLTDPADPGSYWPVPPGAPSDTSPGSGAPSGTAVWDLLFAGDDPWTFDELHQSDLLASGTVGAAAATVDPALMRKRATVAAPERTGDLSRMFRSRLSEGDGISKVPGIDGTTAPPEVAAAVPHTGGFETWLYRGRLQDYAMHVPARYPSSKDKWPLLLYLHGFGGNPDEAFYLPLGLVARADQEGYLVASLRGRGDRFYTAAGDLDVVEVLRDVKRHYRVDPDRVYLMGHSMGGYGTNNVSTHHPDSFAAVAPVEGTSSQDLSDNLLNVPWFEISADEDLDFGGADAKALYDKLSAAGLDATLLIFELKIHEYSTIYDTLDELFEFFGRHRRTRNPAIVSWTRRPADDHPDLGLVYDGAYWLRGVTAADTGRPATIRAESSAIAHAVRDPAKAQRLEDSIDTGGPSGRTKAARFRTIPDPGTPAKRANRLTVTASNTRAFRADAKRAGLRLKKRRSLVTDVASDQPVEVTLTGLGKGAVRVRIDGGRWTRARLVKGAITRTLPAGKHRLALRRR